MTRFLVPALCALLLPLPAAACLVPIDGPLEATTGCLTDTAPAAEDAETLTQSSVRPRIRPEGLAAPSTAASTIEPVEDALLSPAATLFWNVV